MNLVFCLVSLLGAFLLFQVQPVISKFILPWFGGSPGVWTTCMLFFQVLLFGGYTYAHFVAKLKPRKQALLHGAMLLLAACLLPIVPSASLKPSGHEEPVTSILLLLALTVGLPYLVLSATSPLVQVWFSHRFPDRSPWRLYSLSNVGSLTALITYPILIEPQWDVLSQAKIWSFVFVVFALLMGACAFTNRVRPDAITPEGDLHPDVALHQERPTWFRRLLWLLLPAFASLTLLATTNHICQDVAVIPFLWVVPLSLYLLSFIICFDHSRWYVRGAWAVLAVAVIFLASGLREISWDNVFGSWTPQFFKDWSPGFGTELVLYALAMFVICMICHGELARLKPGTKHLTEYYLLMSAGGALGGLLVSIVAPLVFTTFLEWSIALVVGFMVASWCVYRGVIARLGRMKLVIAVVEWVAIALVVVVYIKVMEPGVSAHTIGWLVAAGVLALTIFIFRKRLLRLCSATDWLSGTGWSVLSLAAVGLISIWEFDIPKSIERSRDFYGALSISDKHNETTGDVVRYFYCSGTVHGVQNTNPERRRDPLSYYGRNTGIGLALESIKAKPDARVGVIGMGAGTVAAYAEPGQTYHYYEINPNVVKIADERFTYIPDMKARGAKFELALGDARLSMEDELRRGELQNFDVLLVDAFSGDSVPVHLLTREAFELFIKHLKPDGIIAVHITNHYLNLNPVVRKAAEEFHLHAIPISRWGLKEYGQYGTDYILLTRNEAFIKATKPTEDEEKDKAFPNFKLWTDHRHNLFEILQNR